MFLLAFLSFFFIFHFFFKTRQRTKTKIGGKNYSYMEGIEELNISARFVSGFWRAGPITTFIIDSLANQQSGIKKTIGDFTLGPVPKFVVSQFYFNVVTCFFVLLLRFECNASSVLISIAKCIQMAVLTSFLCLSKGKKLCFNENSKFCLVFLLDMVCICFILEWVFFASECLA